MEAENRDSLAMMNERGSGEGAGYVAYGIYPDYKDYYALHVFFDKSARTKGQLTLCWKSGERLYMTNRSEPMPSQICAKSTPPGAISSGRTAA